jgi:hypothetical protein
MGFRRNSAIAAFAVFLSLVAQTRGQRSSGESSSKPAAKHAQVLDPGTITGGIYRNPSFGFNYKLPFGWVERTSEMQEDASPDTAKARVLLALFERPPEATGETPNSAVLIAAESISSYPGLKTAADYFSPFTEVTTAKGFKVANEPYEFSIGAKQLARSDFTKELKTITIHQSTLTLLVKGYIVSFTFVAASDDDVQEMIDGLSAGAPGRPSATPPSRPKK